MTDKIREAFEAILNHNYEPDVIHVHTVMQLEEVVREYCKSRDTSFKDLEEDKEILQASLNATTKMTIDLKNQNKLLRDALEWLRGEFGDDELEAISRIEEALSNTGGNDEV